MAAAALALLASASQNQTGTSDALDVSNHAQIRMTIAAAPDMGKRPQLDVWFDTAPAAAGPWREIEHVRMSAANNWDSAKRVVLDDADAFVRARWALKYFINWDGTPQVFTMGITGTGVVSA